MDGDAEPDDSGMESESEAESESEPQSEAGGQARCTDLCEWKAGCGSDPKGFCAKEECPLLECMLRPDAQGALFSCAVAQACGTPDDVCWAEVEGAVEPTMAVMAWTEDCEARRAECAGAAWDDDWCIELCGDCEGPIAGVTDAHVAALSACLAEPCGAIEACLYEVVASTCP